jgi:hypothetical protein
MMADSRQFEKLKSALGPAADCPPLDELARALEPNASDARRRAAEDHAAGCAYCRDELALMRDFVDTSLRPEETRPVQWIARRLEKQPVIQPSRQRLSFFFGMRAWVTAACLVLVAASAFYLRQGPGGPSPSVIGDGVMRSQALELVAPVGDVRQAPVEFRWHAVPGAVRYEVRLMEVDRREVWRGEASDNFLAIPPAVAALISPGRNLLWEVSAVDHSGKTLGTSPVRSFRVFVESR